MKNKDEYATRNMRKSDSNIESRFIRIQLNTANENYEKKNGETQIIHCVFKEKKNTKRIANKTSKSK